jgi:hypothetical protein
MAGSTPGGLRRALRWFTLGSGPLKRRSDRVQVLGRVVVVLALLAAAPLGVVATEVTRGSMESAAAVQVAQRHPARAVVLEDTVPAAQEAGDPGTSFATVQATWRAPGGHPRQGALLVPTGTVAGTTVPVWVDRSGELTTAPMDQDSIDVTGFAAGVVATVAVPLVAWVAYCMLSTVLDAHRRRRWAQEWDRVEREWRTRLR